MQLRVKHWRGVLRESSWLAFDSIRSQPARSTLAILGIIIGIITVVLVASVLANVRNSVALLFRELVEGASASFFEIGGADFAAGRPFTELEERAAAHDAVIGSSLARALFGSASSIGRSIVLGGKTYFVVGETAPRKGGFFGENRQDRVMALPVSTVARRFPEAENTVLYAQVRTGRLDQAWREMEANLRRLRRLPPEADNDFTLSTSESIIRTFDEISALVGLVTVALAAVSLFIGGIGIANVMIISVTERTREIGLRLAIGAQRREVLGQFLIEATTLSVLGGAAGVVLALALGGLITLFVSGFSAIVPLWAIAAGLTASLSVGIVAGYWPARRAAGLDPVEALRYE
jgi:putative ABC transport system permease protein